MEPITIFILVVALMIVWALRNVIAVGIVFIAGAIGVGVLFVGAVAIDLFNHLRTKIKRKK